MINQLTHASARVRLILCALLGVLLLSGLGTLLRAQQVVTLTTPVVKTATTCAVDSLVLDLTGNRITVNLRLNSGDTQAKIYDGTTTPTGATLLHNLNTANFSGAVSLINAVHNRLSIDGVCSGTVSGTPQD